MKLSIVVSTQPASFTALAYKGRLDKNLVKIKKFGYDGVELAVRDPELLNVDDLEKKLKEKAIPVSALGTGQAYGEEGLSFTHPDHTIRKKAVERIKSQITLASRLDAVVIIGLIRGRTQQNVPESKAEEWMLEAFRELGEEDPNVKLVIEPINRYETDILNTVESAMQFLDKLNMDNVGLLLDTFHMNIEEPSMYDSIEEAKDRLFHFHVADSNRWYPGGGHIKFENIINLLKRIGYQKFVSAEILPHPDPDTAALKTIECLGPMIK